MGIRGPTPNPLTFAIILLDTKYLARQNSCMMKIIDGDKLRGHLDMLVMAVLEQGEAHGYAVLQRLEARGCDALKMKEGTLYPVPYRLEEAGSIRGCWEDSKTPRRGPRR